MRRAPQPTRRGKTTPGEARRRHGSARRDEATAEAPANQNLAGESPPPQKIKRKPEKAAKNERRPKGPRPKDSAHPATHRGEANAHSEPGGFFEGSQAARNTAPAATPTLLRPPRGFPHRSVCPCFPRRNPSYEFTLDASEDADADEDADEDADASAVADADAADPGVGVSSAPSPSPPPATGGCNATLSSVGSDMAPPLFRTVC